VSDNGLRLVGGVAVRASPQSRPRPARADVGFGGDDSDRVVAVEHGTEAPSASLKVSPVTGEVGAGIAWSL
jgi:hypothetical protein